MTGNAGGKKLVDSGENLAKCRNDAGSQKRMTLDSGVASEASIERAKARALSNGASLWGGC